MNLPSSFVLNFAPTGMVPKRSDSPHVPLDPAEIADQVIEAAAIGITAAHLHARSPDGTPSHDPSIYGDIIGRIRRQLPELVICVSLSGRFSGAFEDRSAPLTLSGDLKPDMASLTLSSLNFAKEASVNAPDMVARLAREMLARGVVAELECFDTGMINYAKYLADRGLIRPPFYFNLMLGGPSGAQADPLTIGTMIAMLPPSRLWAAGGIGRAQPAALALSLASGGGARTGLEDNLFLDAQRTTLATNLQLVRQAHDLGRLLGRGVMTPVEFRAQMGLAPGNGAYGREPILPESR